MPRKLKAATYFQPGLIPLRVMRLTSQDDIGEHQHEFSELVIITGGYGIHTTGGMEYPILAGDVFVLSGSTAHGYKDAQDLSLINILFNTSALQIPEHDIGALPGFHALFNLEPRYRARHRFRSRLRLSIHELEKVNDMVKLVETELEQRAPGFQYHAVAGLMTLFGFLCRCYSRSPMPSARPLLRLGKVVSYLEQHLAEKITMPFLTGMAHMSESSLRRAFREATGYAPIDYLIRLRITRAEKMLRATDARISEIAWQTGFEDSNYFTRQFRRITGRSPRDYRRKSK